LILSQYHIFELDTINIYSVPWLHVEKGGRGSAPCARQRSNKLLEHSLSLSILLSLRSYLVQDEVSRLTGELSRARDTLANLETDLERERRKTTLSGSGGTLSGGTEVRSAGALVRKYGELYAQTRLDTLESLDRLPELDNLDDLKSKLLFSVIVVSKKGDRNNPVVFLFLPDIYGFMGYFDICVPICWDVTSRAGQS
jgi:hypothetical protein